MNLIEISKIAEVVSTSTYDQSLVGGDPTYVSDVHSAFVVLINHGINKTKLRPIAHVMSPTALTILQSAAIEGFARVATGLPDDPLTGGSFIGLLNDVMVFIDVYADDSVPHRTILVNAEGGLVVSEVHLKNISFF